jgi:hypothetical protein
VEGDQMSFIIIIGVALFAGVWLVIDGVFDIIESLNEWIHHD